MQGLDGIIGTLLGTILGWILARCNIGKLYISLGSYDEVYLRHNLLGGMVSATTTGELIQAELSFVIHLYNSYPINRTIRECELVMLDSDGSVLSRMPVRDLTTKRRVDYVHLSDAVGVVNLDGYKSKDIQAFVIIDDIDLLYKIARIEFHYKNEKRKEKILRYKDIAFPDIPRNNAPAAEN